jgi:hypothetical protein
LPNRRPHKIPFSHECDDVEVEPPERGGHRGSKYGRRNDAGIDVRVGTHPDRDDRLSEGDDDDEPMPLGEVARRQPPSLGAEEEGLGYIERQGDRPKKALKSAVSSRGDEQKRNADRCSACEAECRPHEAWVVTSQEHEEGDVRGAHDAVRTREEQSGVVERARDAKRRDEKCGHRGEDHDANCSLLGIDNARKPGVADPRPPQNPEDKEAAREPLPRRGRGHQCSALCDREDEDEIKEELERRNSFTLAQDSTKAGSRRHASHSAPRSRSIHEALFRSGKPCGALLAQAPVTSPGAPACSGGALASKRSDARGPDCALG